MRVGTVYLVGAGPGDPGLLTVRGRDLIRRADVIVYDRLVNPRVLAEARPDAITIDAGKRAGGQSLAQEQINELLISHARQARDVVRLKGGDPFVFGRGGEEAAALAGAGIPFEIVPGVSAAVAVPAYAGIPVTHRGVASSFAVVTGHEDRDKSKASVDWAALATAVDTLVVMMAAESLPAIVNGLLRHGRDPATPIALIRWGTTSAQRLVTGRLRDILARTERVTIAPPVVVVVGDVVALRSRLAWFAPAMASGGDVPLPQSAHAGEFRNGLVR